ncbi:MAG: ABC transporter ATP-binding protein [Candidatus Syntropharchaeia archaeon]
MNVCIEEGDSFAFIGPNGAGKTTLVRILSTLTKPTSGTAEICGYDLLEEPEKIRSEIGVVSHNTFLYDELSARENLSFFADLYRIKNAENRIESLLEKVDLLNRADDLVSEFSRGMKQRLSIIRAIIHKPRILILDEPSTGLDVLSRRIFYEMIREMHASGTTIVLTSHDFREVEEICSKAAIMDRGKIIECGDLQSIKGDKTIEEKFLELLD